MSDFVGGGANTSGGRGAPSMRTPRDIMADRMAREARREAEASRQRDEAQASAEYDRMRAAAAASERMAGTESSARMPEDMHSNVTMRQRSQSQSGPQAPKAQPLPGHRRSQTAQSGTRVSSAPNPPHGAHNNDDSEDIPQRPSHASFPHAFERWEDLSSHWEGLTSYWLRKIEANTEEIRRTIPTASGMQRQIQDLSAAGANLFHGLVELQRLRASSERKFQRWFWEMKQEQERSAEMRAELSNKMLQEREAKEQALAALEQARRERHRAEQTAMERAKELDISKAEARRAWESLGSMEADQHAWIGTLRMGLPTVIGGVQVLPMHAASHQSSERRPISSEGAQITHQPMPEHQRYHDDEPSPTNTDPFTESSTKPGQHLHHEPDVHALTTPSHQPYLPGSTPASTSTARTAISPQQQRRALSPRETSPRPHPRPAATHSSAVSSPSMQSSYPTVAGAAHGQPELFYQQPPGKVYLHSSPPDARSETPIADAPQASEELRSRQSFGSATTEDTEYEMDEHGNVRRDAQGRPIIFRRPSRSHGRNESQESDDYDVDADVAHERDMAARYGIEAPAPPHAPSTSAEAMATFATSASEVPVGYSSAEPADYEGAGYGDWEGLQSRHHHPTRLSDVLEEDERSRTTAE